MIYRHLASRFNPSGRTRTSANDKVVTTQRTMSKLRKPEKRNQRYRRQASFPAFWNSVLTRRFGSGIEYPIVRLLVSNAD